MSAARHTRAFWPDEKSCVASHRPSLRGSSPTAGRS